MARAGGVARSVAVLAVPAAGCAREAEAALVTMPELSELRPSEEPPDPLVCLDGTRVASAGEWHRKRKPEIRELFRHFVHGHAPPPPDNLEFTLDREERRFLGGKATLKELTLTFGPPGCEAVRLLVVVPNARHPGPSGRGKSIPPRRSRGVAPVILAVNFRGNHTVMDDARVRLSTGWVYSRSEGVVKNRATENARGTCKGRWEIEDAVDRGWAVATFHASDVDPDFDEFGNGVHKAYRDAGARAGEDYDWGAVAAWAWGMSRAVDYLVRDEDIDGGRIVAAGHSRLGKTALLAGATDERFAAAISNNSGCTGAALARNRKGETVRKINDCFPHWFNANYKHFNDREDLLPVDQHMLIALVAPRPVLVNSGEKDAWADPEGEFLSAKLADPVYRLLGTDGLAVHEMPQVDTLGRSRIGYNLRRGGHGVGKADWKVWMDFLDRHLPPRE